MNWTNYDDVLAQMRLAGLVVDSLETGRIRRCKVEGDRERRGWYLLHDLPLESGELVMVGTFGVWRGNSSNAQKVELKITSLSMEQKAALKARIAEDQRQAERVRKRNAARAAERAQNVWNKCARDGESPYLKRKGVQAHGVRFTPSNAVVVPMLDTAGRIHGLQFIHAAKRNGRDKDYWPAGLSKQGHFHQIGPVPTAVLLVAEGYATAASLFEATGWPVAVAFDAGNLIHVTQALAKRYQGVHILVCADDDFLTEGNPGVQAASAAALAVSGAWLAPVFAADRGQQKITDFNDLHAIEGLHQVRAQVETRLRQLGWLSAQPAHPAPQGGGEGEETPELRPIESTSELLERFYLVYEMPETVFDAQEHKLVPLSSMRNLCTSRMIHRAWMESATKKVVRIDGVGFDPSGEDPSVVCNLWSGWPIKPVKGDCESLLELLYHLCKQEKNPDEVYQWTLKWLAYPLQYPGTKMKTALVFHGPQGSGKNMFFEAYAAIFQIYARIIDQGAVEDKFNDWASRKLFLIADEVVARAELFHIKNKLKGLVTGDTIRINPKNVGAYEEKNHLNMVFLSNEVMPAVLERDDRRYLVVWTPPKLDTAFYEAVKMEIENGGVAALYDHLLRLPLGDFKPWTLPPVTDAKRTLIDVSMGSSERFIQDWLERLIPLPVCPCRTEDLFEAFRFWQHRTGSKGPSMTMFITEATRRARASKERRRHYVGDTTASTQSTVFFPEGSDTAMPLQDLSDHVRNFADSVRAWKRQHMEAAA